MCFPILLVCFGGFVLLFGFGRFRVRWGPKGPTSPNPSLFLLSLFFFPFFVVSLVCYSFVFWRV